MQAPTASDRKQLFLRSSRGKEAPTLQPKQSLPSSAATRCLLLLLGCLFTGCATPSVRDLTLGPSYRPANTFAASPVLPLTLRRVALLPLATDAADFQLTEAQPALQAVLQAELAKTHKFEVLEVSPEFLKSHTGRGSWGGEEALPAELLDSLHRAYGCDGVLFCRLTAFRGYAPLAVGWRLRLVEAHTATTLWAADELFDAGQPAVSAGARRYQLAELHPGDAPPEEWTIAHSPRQFAHYAVAQVLATLPQR
jgi:hypothetical protein